MMFFLYIFFLGFFFYSIFVRFEIFTDFYPFYSFLHVLVFVSLLVFFCRRSFLHLSIFNFGGRLSYGACLFVCLLSTILTGSLLSYGVLDSGLKIFREIHFLLAFFVFLLFFRHVSKDVKYYLKVVSGALVVVSFAFGLSFFLKESGPLEKVVSDYSYPYGNDRFAPALTSTLTGGFVPEHTMKGSFQCGNCHSSIVEQWSSSMHRHAASDPAYVTNISLLVETRGIEAARYCEGCHAPIALLSGELTPNGQHGGVEGTVANQEGVACLICHSSEISSFNAGNGSFMFVPDSGASFLGQHNASFLNSLGTSFSTKLHKSQMGFNYPSFQICGACHKQFMDESLNKWGWVPMQDEYSAWLNSPFSGASITNNHSSEAMTCVDCHMPLVEANDPSADFQGKVRSHRFIGANTFIPKLTGDSEQFEETVRFLKANRVAVTISIPDNEKLAIRSNRIGSGMIRPEDTFFAYINDAIEFDVVVSNVSVGHDFPGGTIDLNEAWLDVSVTDGMGREFYRSGELLDDGAVDPSAHFYKSIPVDRRGKHVWKHDLFNMTGDAFKRVIPAGKSDVAHYRFVVPSWAETPLSIRASLKYRKLNNKYARWALKDLYFPLPITEMAFDELEFPVFLQRDVYPAF